MTNKEASIFNILSKVEKLLEEDQYKTAIECIDNLIKDLSGNLTDKELSYRAYLIEARDNLENRLPERALEYILNALDIVTGIRYGDFEYGFLKRN